QTEAREHNAANQIKSTTTGTSTLSRYYDPNGNLLEVQAHTGPLNPPRQICVYDAWNRLTHCEHVRPGEMWDIADYAYNGLNWKVREQRHIDEYPLGQPAGSPAQGDYVTWTFYSPAWQQMQEVTTFTDTGEPPAVHHSQEQQFWGLRGADDALLRRIDGN